MRFGVIQLLVNNIILYVSLLNRVSNLILFNVSDSTMTSYHESSTVHRDMISLYNILYHIITYHIISHCIILYYIILHYIILHYIIPCHILFYYILFYYILYYIMSHNIELCPIILSYSSSLSCSSSISYPIIFKKNLSYLLISYSNRTYTPVHVSTYHSDVRFNTSQGHPVHYCESFLILTCLKNRKIKR